MEELKPALPTLAMFSGSHIIFQQPWSMIDFLQITLPIYRHCVLYYEASPCNRLAWLILLNNRPLQKAFSHLFTLPPGPDWIRDASCLAMSPHNSSLIH